MGGKSTKDEYPRSPSTPNMASLDRRRGDTNSRTKKISNNNGPVTPISGGQRDDNQIDYHEHQLYHHQQQQLDSNKMMAPKSDEGGDDHNQFTPSKQGSFKRGSPKRSSWKRGSNALSKFGQSIRYAFYIFLFL